MSDEPMPEQMQLGILTELYGVTATPRPWAIWTLPKDLAEQLTDKLGQFVDLYNDTWALSEDELIWPCWTKHRALVGELAVLYAQWIEAHQAALALSPEKAAYWLDRWLPHFQERVRTRLFGIRGQRCTADEHVGTWRPAGKAAAAIAGRGDPAEAVQWQPRPAAALIPNDALE